ncbi:GPW/gp25 family protein [Porphyrobacter sp. YT40]|uniref:GPW/gp25 family protein n=1 Tax=Porphyrobacter sp. YT40 TaxID=2547601 RepID=UPI00336BCA34
MAATTGKPISDEAHLAQSIGDILSTPLGSRVMRRDYGSLLFELVDKPINGAIRLLLQAATAIALRRWEPRLQLTRVTLAGEPAAGRLTIRIEGRRTDLPPSNALTTLTIPIDTRAPRATS